MRQTLYVVPMRVRQQNLDACGAILPCHQLETERADAGACIQDDELPAGAFDRHARRVSAVSSRRCAGSRNTSPGSPKGHRVRHACGRAQTWAKLLVISDVEQAAASPVRRDPTHEPPRPAACSRAGRSRMRMSLRLTSIIPLSTSSRMVRETVSRDEPIIWAIV